MIGGRSHETYSFSLAVCIENSYTSFSIPLPPTLKLGLFFLFLFLLDPILICFKVFHAYLCLLKHGAGETAPSSTPLAPKPKRLRSFQGRGPLIG